MNLTPEQARARLVEALRSGKYVQARASLRSVDGERYCCLGVACDLYREHALADWTREIAFWHFLGEEHVLPERVRSWLGFKHDGGVLKNPIRGSRPVLASLVDMNDGGRSFAEIADEIEQGNVVLEEEDTLKGKEAS